MKHKLAIVVSHPIQHFVPFYRALAQEPEIDLVVIYCSRIGVEPYFDKAMNTTITWKMDLLGDYEHVFLPEADSITATGPRSVNNPSVGAELMKHAPDVVLIHGYNYITTLLALYWCNRNRVAAMMISDSQLKPLRLSRTRMIKKLLLPHVLRRFDAFLTVGDCNREYYLHYGVPRERLFSSPFTIDEPRYVAAQRNRSALRSACRAELGISDNEVMVLTVGKLSRRKRPSDVIEAARAVKAAGNEVNLRFVLAGNGEEMERLQVLVKREELPVLLTGFVNVDRLPEHYAAADILLHPAGIEPFGLVVPEACCIGLPLVLSAAVGAIGAKSPARPGENALVFPVGEISAIVECVSGLAQAPIKRAQMASRSLEIFNELNMTRSVRGALEGIEFLTQKART